MMISYRNGKTTLSVVRHSVASGVVIIMNVLIGTGSYLPDHAAASRPRARLEEATSDMAIRAAKRAIDDAGLCAHDLDLIVMASCTSDYWVPPAAALVQASLETDAKYLHIDAACCGFVEALWITDALLCGRQFETALIVCADALSRICEPDSDTSHMFGDGAGAVVVARTKEAEGYGVASFMLGSDDRAREFSGIEVGGSRRPWTSDAMEQAQQYLRCDFSRLEPWAVERMNQAVRGAVQRAGITLSELTWIVPQQTSPHVTHELARLLELPESKFIETFHDTGNIASASIPIALDDAKRRGKLAHGDWLALPSAGVGTGWGGLAYRWYDAT
jgi:3-oxoacyl-[acyl-carrier-protein] synthase-3